MASSAVTPFVQALAGWGHAQAALGFADSPLEGSSASDSLSGLSLAFGGGVDIRAGNVTFRVAQVDYQTVRGSGDSTGGVRFSVGVVFKKE
jgi:hypothetical protein